MATEHVCTHCMTCTVTPLCIVCGWCENGCCQCDNDDMLYCRGCDAYHDLHSDNTPDLCVFCDHCQQTCVCNTSLFYAD